MNYGTVALRSPLWSPRLSILSYGFGSWYGNLLTSQFARILECTCTARPTHSRRSWVYLFGGILLRRLAGRVVDVRQGLRLGSGLMKARDSACWSGSSRVGYP